MQSCVNLHFHLFFFFPLSNFILLHHLMPAISGFTEMDGSVQKPFSYSSYLVYLNPGSGGLPPLEEALGFHLISSHHHTTNELCVSFQIAAFKQGFGSRKRYVFMRESLVEEEELKFQKHRAVFKSCIASS